MALGRPVRLYMCKVYGVRCKAVQCIMVRATVHAMVHAMVHSTPEVQSSPCDSVALRWVCSGEESRSEQSE
eukprot:scaffold24455_cov52-Phaeocystis_antarctica.AAC.2